MSLPDVIRKDLTGEQQPNIDNSGSSKYQPISSGMSLGTYVPSSMAYETRQALLKLQAIIGDVDAFVTNRLKYPDVPSMHAAFAAEQVDALALAIFNVERGEGMIIGDQTGIGKGRTAAGMVRYGVLNGYPTIFVTEKPTLFSDLYRDLYDIGSVNLVPLIINTDPTATIEINIDADTKVKLHDYLKNDNVKPKTINGLKTLLGEYVGNDLPATFKEYADDITYLPPGYNFVMVTYSQMSDDFVAKQIMKKNGIKVNEKESASQYKTTFLANYARNSIVIMDEAHNASGGESATGYFVKYGLLERAKGCCYLSGTFAKRPDNMGVYSYKTAIKHTKLEPIALELAFSKGGIALQEIVSSDLVRAGQMLRRQRTFEGIEVIYDYLEKDYERHAEIYDRVIRIVSQIIWFEETFIYSKLKEISDTLGFGGDKAEKTKGTQQGGVDNSPFFNKTHHIIRQLLFSVKAKDVARKTVEYLNQDKKIVIAFASTMESFLAELNLTDGDIVPSSDFSLVLKKALEGALKYTVSSGSVNNGTYQSEHYYLNEDDFEPVGAAALKALKEEINRGSIGIMLSPIDTLINEIQKVRKPKNVGGGKHDYYIVRECTGRKGRLVEEDGQLVYRTFKTNVKKFFGEFNSGDADVLLINQSASTGVSAHSSETFRDQRQRGMIIHQPELDINTEIQKRGRINRTGQVNKPFYIYLSSSIPAERRIFMVLKRKLKSLDANTTGNQRSNQQALEVEDFFNKYGDLAVAQYLSENEEVARATRIEINYNSQTDQLSYPPQTSEIFSRRIALLPVKEQERSYKAIVENYQDIINDLKERGEYDLEVEFLNLEAEVFQRTILVTGSGFKSPFGRHAVADKCRVNVLRKPFKWSEVQGFINKALGGKTAAAYYEQTLAEYEFGREEFIKYRTQNMRDRIIKIQNAVLNEEYSSEKGDEAINSLKEDIERMTQSLNFETRKGVQILKKFQIGLPVGIPEGETTKPGVITNVYFSKPVGDPTRYSHANIKINIAIYGPGRSTTLKFKDPRIAEAMLVTETMDKDWLESILYNWNRMDVKDLVKQDAYIITGNILLAMSKYEGRLIKFTTNTGAINSGILVNVGKENKEGFGTKTQKPITALADELMLSRPGEKRFYVNGSKLTETITFQRKPGDQIQVTVPGTNQFKNIWSDQDLLSLTESKYAGSQKKFTTLSGNIFEANVSVSNIQRFLEVMYEKFKLTYLGDSVAYVEENDVIMDDAIVEVKSVNNPTMINARLQQLTQMIKYEMA